MAESVVSFLLKKLSELLHEERHLLGGLEQEVQSIRDEMGQMKEFLRGFVERDDSSPNLEWIGQLREIAYDVEDVLDRYLLRFRQRRAADGFNSRIKKACTSIKNLKARHQIASEIKAIKYRLQNVSTSWQRYRDMNANIDQASSSTFLKNECYDGRGDALFLDENDVVGIEEPKEQLLEWVHSKDSGLEVISVVGMGGLGKTTLVKKVYDEESVKRHFYHHIWIIASEYKDVKHMLASLIIKLVGEIKGSPPQELEGMSIEDMKEFIYVFLKEKNYIIVLDDVWNISTWQAIKFALPRRAAHGCVIIVTRSYNIANASCCETNHVYELKPLPEEESRELFHKKAFPINPCPHYIEEFAEKILKRCEGLPLAISIIGGLLATKDNHAEEWEKFERSLGHELSGGGSLEILGKSLISLSYNDLPYYLKYCYLYLSIFLEDGLLEKEKIIRLWIAEGFVQPKKDKTMEEVAVDYLSDLFNRSLIHIISKSGEHNIVTVSNGGDIQWPTKIRRLAVQKSSSSFGETYNMKCLRSLLLLCSRNMELGIISEMVGKCKLLKVLDLSGAPVEIIPNEVFKLYYLKYLSLRSTMVKLIPKSIKYLENLETLDLKNCNVTSLPPEILKLQKLRHLLLYTYHGIFVSFHSIKSFKAPFNIGISFPSLLKLFSIDANEIDGMKMVREIGKLTQLRRLGIAKLRSEDGEDLCSSLAKLTNLRSLRIDSVEEGEKLDLDYSVSLPFLRSLTLKGCIEKVPGWIRSLNGLTTLNLAWSRLADDPLSNLQDLPNLASLWIHGSYVEGLSFEAQGFQKLKSLGLAELECLKRVIVEKGSMPLLQEWHIRDCEEMIEPPQGIEHLTNLQLLPFANMEDEFVRRVFEEKKNEGDNWRLARVCFVGFFNVMDDGKWRLDFKL